MRIMDMTGPQKQAEIFEKRFSAEGHIPDGVKALERVKRNDKNVSVVVLLPKFRLSYPQLVEAKEGEYQGAKTAPRYSAVGIFDPADVKGLIPFWRAAYALAFAYLGKKAEPFLMSVNNGSSLIKPNEDYIAGRKEKGKETEGLDQLYKPGGVFMNFTRTASKGAVLLVGKDRQAMNKETAVKELYAGCYVQAVVEIFPMDGKLATRLVSVIKVGEGDRIGGAARGSVNDFNNVSVMDEAQDPALAALEASMNEGSGAAAPTGGLFG